MLYDEQHLNNIRLERKKLQETLQYLENPTLNKIGLVRRKDLALMWRGKIKQLCKQEIELSRRLYQVQKPEQKAIHNPVIVLVPDTTLEKKLDKSPSVFELKLENNLFLFLAHKLLTEDCVAELTALYHQLQAQNKPKWLIVITITWNFLELFWAFYIQIKIENLWLPQRKVDD